MGKMGANFAQMTPVVGLITGGGEMYHVGLIKTSGNNMQFQFRKNLDCMSCELYQYYGVRLITKKAFLKSLRLSYHAIEKQLRQEGREFNRLLLTVD
jgi:hypothetical protein